MILFTSRLYLLIKVFHNEKGIDFWYLIINSQWNGVNFSLYFSIKSKDTFWLVRPHPTSKLYRGSNIVKDYIKKIKSDNLKVVDESVSTKILLRLSDKIVTCNGSIALEAGYFNKKVILAGKSFYSDLKFSFLPKTKADYQNLILNLKRVNSSLHSHNHVS